MVTVGGSEALLFAFAAICDAGDEIIVAEPYYTNYSGYAHLLGVTIKSVLTEANDGFDVHPGRVAEAITPRTRAVVLPTPGNPTGAVIDAKTLATLGRLCVERGVFLITDEVYRDFVYDLETSRAPSVLELPGLEECAIMVDSVSKRYSACGARIGCLVTRNPQVYNAALKFAQARLSPPTVDQLAGQAALSTPASWLSEAVEMYKGRRDLLVERLNTIEGVSCPNPKGAFYFMADLPVKDTEDFCIFMLRDFNHDGETVMFAPGEGFYATEGLGRHQVRVAYVLEEAKLSRCVEILRAGLEAYHRR
jgi:aspartate aminotransferase